MDFNGKRNRDNAFNGIRNQMRCLDSLAEVHCKFIALLLFI